MRILLTLIGMEWFYQAIEQYQYITVRNLLFKFISLLLLFALVKKPEDYLLYCGINIFGVYGSYLSLIHIFKRDIQDYHGGWTDWCPDRD